MKAIKRDLKTLTNFTIRYVYKECIILTDCFIKCHILNNHCKSIVLLISAERLIIELQGDILRLLRFLE